ncbi:hypothetical protein ABE493_16035 [Stenotrophomonas terrae]|uniref:hypothetical protein n=1 Tax=Stenotrophomonas terrae TaxID=405446 RepID=UPI00320AFA4F
MKIPPDIHERVADLAAEIVNAGQAGDNRSSWALYEELRSYCEAVASEGRDHPFLWETLADFTADDQAAIALYQRALPLAVAAGADEYSASIHLAVAERYANLDAAQAAHDHALQADAFARTTDDLPLRQAISQFLLDHSPPPSEG